MDPLIRDALEEARENPWRTVAEGVVLVLFTLALLAGTVVLWGMMP